jgi:hypothetical protein
VFTKNQKRLREGEVFQKFMSRLLDHKNVKPLRSSERFSDGTLIEAWACIEALTAPFPRPDAQERSAIGIKAQKTP